MLAKVYVFLFTCYGIILPTPIGLMSLTDICLVPASIYVLLGANFRAKSLFDLGIIAMLVWYLALLLILPALRPNFDIFGHLVNYLRVLALGAIVLSPLFQNYMSAHRTRIFHCLKVATIVHCLIILVDVFAPIPLEWLDHTVIQWSYYHRPRGLFGELSFAAVFLLMVLALNFLYVKGFKNWYVLPLISIVASTSLIGILGLIYLLLAKYFRADKAAVLYLLVAGAVSICTLFYFPPVANQVIERIENVRHDSSGAKRLIGAYLAADFVIQHSPVTGVGLGGGNFDEFFAGHPGTLDYASKTDVECTISGECDATLRPTSANLFINLMTSGGIVALAIYIFCISSLFNRAIPFRYRIFFLYLAVSKGQAFDPLLLSYLYFISRFPQLGSILTRNSRRVSKLVSSEKHQNMTMSRKRGTQDAML